MKKSESVNTINIAKMAEAIHCEEIEIKLALAGPEKRIDMKSIESITTTKRAKKLFDQAKSIERKALIAIEWFVHCSTFAELLAADDHIKSGRSDYEDYFVRSFFIEYGQILLRNETIQLQTIEGIYDLLRDIAELEFVVEERKMIDRMCWCADQGMIKDPVKFILLIVDELMRDTWIDDLVSRIVPHMTQKQALEVLEILQGDGVVGSEGNYTRHLIARAAPLFKR